MASDVYRPTPTSRRPSVSRGPTYVFECPYCHKQFRRSKNDSKLGKHKTKDGYRECPGRRGYLVTMT
jgi:hypothetical protein